MDYNVSTLKNKSSQNKLNTCLSSLKTIINDYKPYTNDDLNYGLFEYEGKVTKDTVLDINGWRPSVSSPVLGQYGGHSFYCGDIRPDGKFYGKEVKYTSLSRYLHTENTTFDYPGTHFYWGLPATTPRPPDIVDLDKFQLQNFPPHIASTKYYTQDEIFYSTSNMDEIILQVTAGMTFEGSKPEIVTITAKECYEYGKNGVSLAILGTILQEKIDVHYQLLDFGFDKKTEGGVDKYALVFAHDAKGFGSVAYLFIKSTAVDNILFSEQTDKYVYGTDGEIFEYNQDIRYEYGDNWTKKITTTNQPQVLNTNIIGPTPMPEPEGYIKWEVYQKYRMHTTVLTEMEGTTTLDSFRICQYYI